MAISYEINGDGDDAEIATQMLPVMVERAKEQRTIYYSQLAERFGVDPHFGLNQPLYVVGTTVNQLNGSWQGESIPHINCIVVNRETGLPGEGIKEFLLNDEERIIKEMKTVFAFARWDEVLRKLGL